MAQQLPLIESRPQAAAVAADRAGRLIEVAPADWRIDQHTKEVGMAGVAAARRALAAAVIRRAA